MRIVSVVGTRPQLVKAAALQPVLRTRHEEIFIDTGQHWDDTLAGAFFRDLGLARPDHSLGAGGGTHAQQTAAMLLRIEPILLDVRPDAVLVYGDTNSTLAGALAAAKLGLPVAHVEAGLRAFDMTIPEEVNRVLVDHLSRWAFAPTPTSVANLEREGINGGVMLVGDLMQDLAARVAAEVRDPSVLEPIAARLQAEGHAAVLRPGAYLYATIHRVSNREPEAVRAWSDLFRRAARRDRPLVFAVHPGTRIVMEALGVDLGPHVLVVEPRDYRTSISLQLHAAAVITDSGGVQREAAWLQTPCLVLRASTEWLEALEGSDGRMAVVGLERDTALECLERIAPLATSEATARARARSLDLRPAGAAEAITVALDGRG
jgi:UDP-N-acetylglucosamine 2-epimerase